MAQRGKLQSGRQESSLGRENDGRDLVVYVEGTSTRPSPSRSGKDVSEDQRVPAAHPRHLLREGQRSGPGRHLPVVRGRGRRALRALKRGTAQEQAEEFADVLPG